MRAGLPREPGLEQRDSRDRLNEDKVATAGAARPGGAIIDKRDNETYPAFSG